MNADEVPPGPATASSAYSSTIRGNSAFPELLFSPEQRCRITPSAEAAVSSPVEVLATIRACTPDNPGLGIMGQIMNLQPVLHRTSTNPDTANQRKERRDHRRVSHPSAPLRQEHCVVVDGVLRA